jgi:hypothetical protein
MFNDVEFDSPYFLLFKELSKEKNVRNFMPEINLK